eukprot:CAMPEP_0194539664 /NCGR_PEP_ID=MMETSP0253-20130528/79673_1 /TAXON_ID=2966 /ORGANISM="Noctiluca scintillans" /LENGTH=34 /DNA_ID= /DNA_START= /DNA_END= /DNA_ORIENTATION=
MANALDSSGLWPPKMVRLGGRPEPTALNDSGMVM